MQFPTTKGSGVLGAGDGVLLPVREAAARLRVSRATVYRLCEEGRLAHVRVSSNAIRIPEEALRALPARAG